MAATELLTLRDGDTVSAPALAMFRSDTNALERLLAEGALVEHAQNWTLNFVGVIVTPQCLAVCLPKKVPYPSDLAGSRGLARLLLRVLRRYVGRSKWRESVDVRLSNDLSDTSVSPLAAAHWLLRDYFANGLYRRRAQHKSTDAKGHISWGPTIARFPAYLVGGRPIYLETLRAEVRSDNAHVVTRLHATALRRCASRYGVLFGVDTDPVDHEPVDPLPEALALSIAEQALGRELARAYGDRSIRLIQVLKRYFGDPQLRGRPTGSEIFGTTAFHHVWECICADLIGNEIGTWLKSLPLPTWRVNGGSTETADTFRPDILRSVQTDAGMSVLLLDAKYYSLRMPPGLRGNPGVYDVAKQLLYEIFIAREATSRGTEFGGNGFLFPGDCDALLEHLGSVGMDGLAAGPIDVYQIGVVRALQRYVSEENMSIGEILEGFRFRAANL